MFCCPVFSHKFSTHHRTVLKQMKLKITFYNYSMSRKRTQKVNIQMKSFTSRQGREWINLHVRPCKKKNNVIRNNPWQTYQNFRKDSFKHIKARTSCAVFTWKTLEGIKTEASIFHQNWSIHLNITRTEK